MIPFSKSPRLLFVQIRGHPLSITLSNCAAGGEGLTFVILFVLWSLVPTYENCLPQM